MVGGVLGAALTVLALALTSAADGFVGVGVAGGMALAPLGSTVRTNAV